MATGQNIRTFVDGSWHEGDVMIMRAADHGSWLGTTVFDGARYVQGIHPDLDAHCARVNKSAKALMLEPGVAAETIAEIVKEGLALYPKGCRRLHPPDVLGHCGRHVRHHAGRG